MDEKLQRLFWKMGLENTRLLVKGIERLHFGYQREYQAQKRGGRTASNGEDPWQLDKLQEFVYEAYQNSLQGEKYLAQNPYTELFQFRYPTPDMEQMKKEGSSQLSGMLLLYHQLQMLENLPSDQLAQAYETVCDCIRNILAADMCYLVSRHLTDTHMLCASSVTEEDLDVQLGSKEAGELLGQIKESKHFFQLAEGIFLWEKKTANEDEPPFTQETRQQTDTLILSILLYDKGGTPLDEQIYVICQRRNQPLWSSNLNAALLMVRDTLFLRGQLVQALVRDLAGLLSMSREYRNIRRKSPESGPLQILHISDLHVTEANYQRLKDDIEQLEFDSKSFDFLVITGDVIQGRYAAGDLEQNYDCAAHVIRALAFRMWGEKLNGKNVLRQDWKRRTIIIPGNHDYASMNELETQHGENHRASGGGKPATQEGSAMVKFTYYINFIRKLLDIDIGDLIDDSLNDLRCYDKMDVAFLCFNTSIMANPDRNNKVHLDGDFAHRAVRQLTTEKRRQTVIFLGHHGPNYKIDYVSDEYLEPYICQEITQKFVCAILKDKDKDRQKALHDLKEQMDDLKHAPLDNIINNDFVQAWLVDNHMREFPEGVWEKVVDRRKKTRLYKHLSLLLEQLEKDELERSINERYQKIIAEIQRASMLSQYDQKAYNEVFEFLNCLEPAVCLSGHTHEWELDASDHHYTANRFCREKKKVETVGSSKLKQTRFLNYGICSITPGTPSTKAKIVYEKVEHEIGQTPQE